MQKYLNLIHKLWLILFILQISLIAQEKKQNTFMPKFYRDDITKPIKIDTSPVEIISERNSDFQDAKPEDYNGGYFYRYINSAKNSRLNSDFPVNKIWEIKWKAELKNTSSPLNLLLFSDRILVQDEEGWQLFDLTGKSIKTGIKSEGNISIDQKQKLFAVNDFSGYLSLNDLETGDKKFLIYPFMGKGYDRSVIFWNKDDFTSVGYSIPTMTHKTSNVKPDITLFETIDFSDQTELDEDKILYSAVQKNKLICQSLPVKTASQNNEIVIATENNIFVVDEKLNIKSIYTGCSYLEISLDENKKFI